MTARYVGQFTPGTPEWREQRKAKIGGSDVAAIVGLSPWSSAYALFCERKGWIEPPPEKPQMTWGTRLEPVIVAAFEDGHGEFMVDYQPGQVWVHPDRPWQAASPDALIGPNPFTVPPVLLSGLEVKTSRFDDGWGPEGSQDIPAYYSTQVQWCMDVFGVNTWHVAALFGGSDYREYVVHAQPHLQTLLRETAKDFLDSLQGDAPPPLDSSPHTYSAVRSLHPDIEDAAVDLPDDIAARYIAGLRAAKDGKDAETAAKSEVADFMGRAKSAHWNGHKIAYRRGGKPGTTPYLAATNGLLEKELA